MGWIRNTEEFEIRVPQGSCFEQLFFLVFINDLPLAIKNSKASLYADDASIFRCPKDRSQLNNEINDDLDRLEAWLKSSKLSVFSILLLCMGLLQCY